MSGEVGVVFYYIKNDDLLYDEKKNRNASGRYYLKLIILQIKKRDRVETLGPSQFHNIATYITGLEYYYVNLPAERE
jgi:hypothetical protein